MGVGVEIATPRVPEGADVVGHDWGCNNRVLETNDDHPNCGGKITHKIKYPFFPTVIQLMAYWLRLSMTSLSPSRYLGTLYIAFIHRGSYSFWFL